QVVTWTDCSGHGHSPTQATSTKQPIFRRANWNMLLANSTTAPVINGTSGISTSNTSASSVVTPSIIYGGLQQAIQTTSHTAGSSGPFVSHYFPVTPGVTYYGCSSKRGVNGQVFFTRLIWYDNTKALISQNSGSNVTMADITGTWAQSTVSQACPAGISYCRL